MGQPFWLVPFVAGMITKEANDTGCVGMGAVRAAADKVEKAEFPTCCHPELITNCLFW